MSEQQDNPFGTGSSVDGVVLACIVLASVLGVALVLVRAERAALADPDEKALRGEFVGADGDSPLSPDRLGKGLQAVSDRSPAGTVFVSVRLAPDGLSIETREPSTKRYIYRVTPGLETSRSDFGQGNDAGFGPGSLDVQAPKRFIDEVAKRFRYAPKELDYIVYSVTGVDKGPQMLGFWKRDEVTHTFAADARGGNVTSQDAQAAEAAGGDPRAAEAARRTQCLEQAESPEDVERCGSPR